MRHEPRTRRRFDACSAHGRRAGRSSIAFGAIATGVGFASILLSLGCHRAQYRQQADNESYCAIEEKANDPRWAIGPISVEPDPRSRFADPYDADHPPMPPDDPAAHPYMHCANGHNGSKHWHDRGELDQVESPCWRDYLELNDDGTLVLDEQKAVELARIHSSRYHEQMENLYLSALDLTFQRFRFDAWYFAGNNTNYKHFGSGSVDDPKKKGVQGNETNTLSTGTSRDQTRLSGAGSRGQGSGAGTGMLFPSGATMLVDFANSFVWQFTGTNSARVSSGINFTLVQPLLRNAGRKVVLESLTKTERSMLYAVRNFERYRQDFYVETTTGSGRGLSVTRERGLSAGLGEFGFGSAFASAALGGRGPTGTTGGAGVTTGVSGGTGAGQVGGYFGLVQERIQIRNLEYNVTATASSMAQLEALQSAGRVDIVQVDQARQSLQTARSNLLQQLSAYETGLDRYKQTLGLPPDLKVDVDESAFGFLQLTNSEVIALQNETDDALNRVRELADDAPVDDVKAAAAQGLKLLAPSRAAFAGAKRDFAKLDAGLDERLKQVESETEKTDFLQEMQKLAENFITLEGRFQKTAAALEKLNTPSDQEGKKALQQQLTDLSSQLLEVSLLQTRARLEVVPLPTLNYTEQEAIRIARDNELGLMNARAQLVDVWRRIEFEADRLKSDLNLTFNADIETLPLAVNNNPTRFRSANSSYTLGLRFDAPLTRLEERNQYREALIDYQQARRQYIATEDSLVASIRAELRNAALNKNNFKVRRNALVIALRQVDQTREKLNEPPRAGQVGVQTGSTTARDLLEALVNLLRNQNDFISVWFSSEAIRRSFYRDLGLMRVGENGIWLDVDKHAGEIEKAPRYCAADEDDDSPNDGLMQPVGGPARLSPVPQNTPPAVRTQSEPAVERGVEQAPNATH